VNLPLTPEMTAIILGCLFAIVFQLGMQFERWQQHRQKRRSEQRRLIIIGRLHGGGLISFDTLARAEGSWVAGVLHELKAEGLVESVAEEPSDPNTTVKRIKWRLVDIEGEP
jgi:hypothetical protein